MNVATKTPVHLWIVGVAALLWNLIAVSDYTFSKLKSDWYLKEVAQFGPEQLAWLDSFPVWANIGWALGVWGAFLGAILLLMRSRHALLSFAISLVGLAVMTLYQFGMNYDKTAAAMGESAVMFNVLIWAIAIALFFYARAMKANGVLR